MRVLIWGSRNLTWKHLPVFRSLARHALLGEPVPLGAFLSEPQAISLLLELLPEDEPLVLLNGDGPPGRTPGAIGADKLAMLACMEAWPERRRVRWYPPEKFQVGDMTWAQGAAARNVAMAAAKPDRAYVVHEDLDASRGSIITAQALTERGTPYWYVRVSPAGGVISVEFR